MNVQIEKIDTSRYNETMRKFVPKNAKLIPPQANCVFRGEIFDVYQWPQELFDGATATFEMLKRDDTVKVIGIIDDKIVVTRQKQPGKDWFYDYPGGRNDHADEDELAAAKREMLEETGMEFANWKLVEVNQPYNKMDWLVYTFVATGFLGQKEQNLDGGELIEVKCLDFEELKRLSQDSERFLHSKVLRQVNSVEELENLPELKD